MRGISTRRRTAAASRSTNTTAFVVFCYCFFAIIVLLAVFAPVITPHSPGEQHLDIGVTGPSFGSPLGTDELGRDVFSRVIAGATAALYGPVIVAIGQLVIGTALGVSAAYRGGWVDTIIMRWVELMSALPGLLVAIVAIGVLGSGYFAALIILIVLGSPHDVRLIRGAALDQVHRPYVEAAKTLGLSTTRIMSRHVTPNLLPLIIANVFLSFSGALVGLSALSFLGIGVPPGTADWGLMLAENRRILFSNSAAVVAPAVVLALTSVTANIIGDDLFERLTARGTVK